MGMRTTTCRIAGEGIAPLSGMIFHGVMGPMGTYEGVWGPMETCGDLWGSMGDLGDL